MRWKTRLALLFTFACGLSVPVSAYAESFNSNGVNIGYVVKGQGEPVVLIHGLFSSYLINWQLPGTIDLLAKSYQVIAVDMPGFGTSDKPENEAAYGTEMATDVIRLLDHLKIKRAHIVGYSMGGMIAAKLMAMYPDRVLSGTLGGMGWLREGSVLAKFWELGKRDSHSSGPGECMRSLTKLALSEDELKSIHVPVTVIVGDQDPCKMLYVKPLERVRSDWPVVEIRDSGHLNCIVMPQFKEEIKAWLDKQKQH